ncbi:polysaccharide deacetylase family protein [Streptomyces spiralis]|uniref:polysaccharide deacetylase family protein n=1 Tax=Streptomyces sp. NRRL S-813 TaxID=1463919 RepID=UPI000ADF9163|nr:polysaccharide deacetylase [Streptomyces sp. NRRL S-813]
MTPRPAQPVDWPGEMRAAACFSFDVDAESAVLHQHPEAAQRMSVMSHQSYGPLVGVPRLLKMLDRHGVRATFFVPGWTARRHPDTVRAIADAGHEIAHHGYLHEPLTGADPSTEADYLDRGLDALESMAGVRPVGYRAPMWELTYNSPRLLADRGFLYDSSLMDADHPYELAVPGAQSLVEIPIQWALDDWEQYCYLPGISGSGLIESPRKALEIWTLEFEALRREGGCFVLTTHPFLTGRPSRAAALEELVERVSAAADTWVAPLIDIARHVRSLGLSPRTLTPPDPHM